MVCARNIFLGTDLAATGGGAPQDTPIVSLSLFDAAAESGSPSLVLDNLTTAPVLVIAPLADALAWDQTTTCHAWQFSPTLVAGGSWSAATASSSSAASQPMCTLKSQGVTSSICQCSALVPFNVQVPAARLPAPPAPVSMLSWEYIVAHPRVL